MARVPETPSASRCGRDIQRGERREGVAVARQLTDEYIAFFPQAMYASVEEEARLRIPDDPDDWQTIALALATGAAIWTEDKDFFGCGIATWRTPQLRAILEREPDAVAK